MAFVSVIALCILELLQIFDVPDVYDYTAEASSSGEGSNVGFSDFMDHKYVSESEIAGPCFPVSFSCIHRGIRAHKGLNQAIRRAGLHMVSGAYDAEDSSNSGPVIT